jgi:hypothetical protein
VASAYWVFVSRAQLLLQVLDGLSRVYEDDEM